MASNDMKSKNFDLKVVEIKETDSYQGTPLKTPSGKAMDFDESMLAGLGETYIFISSTEVLAEIIIKKLSELGKTLSVAESLTGGELASALIGISGASKVFDYGIVSYSNNAKHNLLDVSEKSLNEYGAVSKAVAEEMVSGVLKHNDFAVSTTGIAGPTGDGICEKVGTVFIGIATKRDIKVYGFHFEGLRDEIRKYTVQASLSLLLSRIMQETKE